MMRLSSPRRGAARQSTAESVGIELPLSASRQANLLTTFFEPDQPIFCACPLVSDRPVFASCPDLWESWRC